MFVTSLTLSLTSLVLTHSNAVLAAAWHERAVMPYNLSFDLHMCSLSEALGIIDITISQSCVVQIIIALRAQNLKRGLDAKVKLINFFLTIY